MAVLYGTMQNGQLVAVEADAQGRLVAELANPIDPDNYVPITGGTMTGNLTVPSLNGGTPDTLQRAGNILQVVQGTTTTEVVVNTAIWTDTTLSATITPTSATSKILIFVDQDFYSIRSNTGTGAAIRILRDTTVIDTPTELSTDQPRSAFFASGGATSAQNAGVYNRLILDSPNTTSSVTYKTEGRPFRSDSSGSATFQSDSTETKPVSNITLIEVAA